MFSTIVIGCDGSRGSLAAIELATRLRDPDGGRLVLTSVYPRVLAIPEFGDTGSGDMERTAQEILRLSATRLPADVPCETWAEAHPSVAGGINDVAERVGADLIVLGPTHLHSLGRLTGRTTVQRLLHGAPCAVAVAVAGQGLREGRIVVAYDGSIEARDALDAAFALAPALGASVELVHAIEPVTYMGPYVAAVDPELEPRVQRLLDHAAATAPDGVATSTRIGWGPAAPDLIDAAEDAALLVAGSRGYGSLHRAIAGSVSGALLTQSEIPVLVTPRGAETQKRAA